MVLVVGLLAVVAIGFPTYRAFPRLADREPLNLMAKWDAEWYLAIAQDGYPWDGSPRHEARLAFFPAYPMAARIAGWAVGGPAAGAALVTFVGFFGALVYFYRLARQDLEASEADAAVQFLAFGPFAVYYSAIYSEALYLLAAVAGFYYFRRRAWMAASCWGIVAGLSRPNGCLLSVVLLVAALDARWRTKSLDSSTFWRGVVTSAMPGVGLGLYCLFVYRLTGDPLHWLRLNSLWGRGESSVWAMIQQHRDWITQLGFSVYFANFTTDFINCVATALAAATIWPVTRRFGPAYGALIALNLAAAISSGTMLSLARLTCTMFPIFLWMGWAIPPARRSYWTAAFAMVQGFAACMFFTWRWLY